MERAHRLGPRRDDTTRPRTLVVRLHRWVNKLALLEKRECRRAMADTTSTRIAADLTTQQSNELQRHKEAGRSAYFRNGRLCFRQGQSRSPFRRRLLPGISPRPEAKVRSPNARARQATPRPPSPEHRPASSLDMPRGPDNFVERQEESADIQPPSSYSLSEFPTLCRTQMQSSDQRRQQQQYQSHPLSQHNGHQLQQSLPQPETQPSSQQLLTAHFQKQHSGQQQRQQQFPAHSQTLPSGQQYRQQQQFLSQPVTQPSGQQILPAHSQKQPSGQQQRQQQFPVHSQTLPRGQQQFQAHSLTQHRGQQHRQQQFPAHSLTHTGFSHSGSSSRPTPRRSTAVRYSSSGSRRTPRRRPAFSTSGSSTPHLSPWRSPGTSSTPHLSPWRSPGTSSTPHLSPWRSPGNSSSSRSRPAPSGRPVIHTGTRLVNPRTSVVP